MTAGLPQDEEEVIGRWPALEDRRMALLLRRWAGWREGTAPPPRSRIDPAALKPCLPHVWIWRLTPDRFSLTCTLAGEKIQEAWGRGIIGNDPLSLWGPESGLVVRDRLRRVALTPAIVHGRSGILSGESASPGKFAERLILPLATDDGAPFGVIGMTLYRYDPVAAAGQLPRVLLSSQRHPCAALPEGLPPD